MSACMMLNFELKKFCFCFKVIEKGRSTSSVYRFRTKSQQWIFLQTHYTFEKMQRYPKNATELFNNFDTQSIHCNHHVVRVNDNQLVLNKKIEDPIIPAHLNFKPDMIASSPRKIEFSPIYHTTMSSSSNASLSNTVQSISSPVALNFVRDLTPTSSRQEQQNLSIRSSSSSNNTNFDESTIRNNSLSVNKKNPIAISDKMIEQIVLMSHARPDFRAHICTQLLLEKKKVETLIKQQQERYNQCDKMIRCFQNGLIDLVDRMQNKIVISITNLISLYT
jgi:hypothetical protein